MHAHLKQREGKNAAIHYCPLDLFSGSKGRLETALGGLWDSWIETNGSINNMRIFNHGKIVLPREVCDYISQIHSRINLSAEASLRGMVTRKSLITS
jgi:Inositol-pentakisphosphate 2-kinase